ncbi:hypothetical protein CAOG_01988 [Capsaspora owczarzaki ATCC 30864]|uniref:CUB domain-containing protein n=1 Tax=Capsaspora owczarzaki (strain ATCC 30864) TaxID=595528 RepID=A0A0D2WLI4_CAPO3|nr:hypothetical protein CAOG_01988 [Capsaspora owczarzaki ATCC 30864]KJE90728.1 hypothetical protein CAOG_001988 [Capsaspora owczarzaki ATCC 30864]|eukprot:XP_004364856.2 hypothetical protein CAOG_01988 [Capsaspora owczarzaki ATCC 30864]
MLPQRGWTVATPAPLLMLLLAVLTLVSLSAPVHGVNLKYLFFFDRGTFDPDRVSSTTTDSYMYLERSDGGSYQARTVFGTLTPQWSDDYLVTLPNDISVDISMWLNVFGSDIRFGTYKTINLATLTNQNTFYYFNSTQFTNYWYAFSVMVLPTNTASRLADCSSSSTLTATQGFIRDGNSIYDINADCNFNVQVASAVSYTLTFYSFATEPRYDVLKFFNSANQLVGSFNGSLPVPFDFTIVGNKFSAEFTSDDTNVDYGFLIMYTANFFSTSSSATPSSATPSSTRSSATPSSTRSSMTPTSTPSSATPSSTGEASTAADSSTPVAPLASTTNEPAISSTLVPSEISSSADLSSSAALSSTVQTSSVHSSIPSSRTPAASTHSPPPSSAPVVSSSTPSHQSAGAPLGGSGGSSFPVAAVAGGVAGGLVLLLVIVLVCRRRGQSSPRYKPRVSTAPEIEPTTRMSWLFKRGGRETRHGNSTDMTMNALGNSDGVYAAVGSSRHDLLRTDNDDSTQYSDVTTVKSSRPSSNETTYATATSRGPRDSKASGKPDVNYAAIEFGGVYDTPITRASNA